MKKMFKSFLMAAVVLTAGAFVACENPESNEKVFEGIPEIAAVADVAGVTFEGGLVTVTVTSNAPWTATVDAADVVLSKKSGNGDATVTVTVPAATAARDIKVTFTAKGVMAGIEIPAETVVSIMQNATGKATISGITPETVGDGADFSLEGVTVVATGSKAYVIADESGAMVVYHADHGRTVGEKINISGQVTIFTKDTGSFGTPQFSSSATVEVVSTGNEVAHNPETVEGAAFDALTNNKVAQEVEVTGTWVVSGNYVNIADIKGASKQGSIQYINNSEYASFDGQTVVIKGYYVGLSVSGSTNYVNIMPYSVEADPNAPQLNVDKSELTFKAADSSRNNQQTFTVTTNDLSGYTLSWVIDNETDFAIGRQIPGGNSRATLYCHPKAANEGSTKSATITITYSNGTKTLTKTVRVIQEGATATVYNLVTSAPADWSGSYVVGCTVATEGSCHVIDAKYSGATATKSTFTYKTLTSADGFTSTAITANDDFSAHMVTIAKIEGTNYYSVKYGDMYVGWTTSTGNSCAFSATAPTASTPDFQWHFEVSEGVAKMFTVTNDSTEAGKERRLQFNSNAGQERFAIYKGTQKDLALFALAK